MRRALDAVGERTWGSADVAGRHVVVSGVGKVGAALVDHLVADGARVTVADVRPEAVAAVRARHAGVAVVDPDVAHATECDVFSPCALGAVLSDATIPELRCIAVCGSANNQLAVAADGPRLAARDVLYAPDYVVNAGGVINIAEERNPSGAPYDRARALDRVAGIAATLRAVLDRAATDGTTPVEAADRLAEERIAAVAGLAAIRTAHPAPPPRPTGGTPTA